MTRLSAKSIVIKMLTALFISIFLNIQVFASSSISVSGGDSLPGVPYYLKVNGGAYGKPVLLNFWTPSMGANNSGGYQFSEVFKVDKSAIFKIPAEVMSENGEYLYEVKYGSPLKTVKQGTVSVGVGSVDVGKSTLLPANQVLTGVGDRGVVKVGLVDSKGNPVEGHYVRLIAGNGEATIKAIGGNLSNSNGEVAFEVTMLKEGAVTLTAYDSTSDSILESRARVALLGSRIQSSLFKASVLDFESLAAMGTGVGELDSFEFSDVPLSVKVGEDISFKVSALDPNGDLVADYDGTVRFSVVDGSPLSANLPGDYTFTTENLGEHTFSLGTTFSSPGVYEVEVRDLAAPTVFGGHTFVVTGAAAVNSSSEGAPVITNPTAGTYSNNVVAVTGTAGPGARLKVFDNSVELGMVIAGSSGNFSYTTNQLVDGVHEFSVAEVNESGVVIVSSATVRVTIDTDAPKISNIAVEPKESLKPGELITVRLMASEPLSRAVMVFEGNFFEMTSIGEDIYEGKFSAPLEVGEYSVDVVLTDELNNDSQYDDYFKVTVVTSNDVPTVQNLKATSGTGRVILSWDDVVTPSNPVTHYRVYYGTSQTELINAVETFTSSNTWYVPNLTAGQTYYFAVVAVDDRGNTSSQLGEVVSSTPSSGGVTTVTVDEQEVVPEVDNGEAGRDALKDLESDVSNTGPGGIMALMFVSLVLGRIFVRKAIV
ncbi:hypothetical protein CVV38_03010 [Candidatus Peregrinibacteria bacterium HGW-Peregrinibacteria-1]|jgi:hypothetical protein|nr:MAG: hypothetical protein CVV38_03010 [Candidatus Peregrinibacteria bacterium HGW-Peregrinibacteria-1]